MRPGNAIPPARMPTVQYPTPVDRMLLTVEEAATALGVGRSLMYELIATGAIDTVRVGRLRRIRPDALQSYVDSLCT